MPKGNLARLDEVVQGAVANELGEGNHDADDLADLGIDPKRTRVIAGLTVVSNAARDAEVDSEAGAMTDKLLRYRADAGLGRSKLKRKGVEPIAILPLKAWNHICDINGLIRFTPNVDVVRMPAGNAILTEAHDKAVAEVEAEKGSLVGGLVIMGIVIALLSLLLGWVWTWYCLWGFVATVVCFIAAAANSDTDTAKVNAAETRRIRALIGNADKAGTLVKTIWPNLREPPVGESAWQIRIGFPTPPPEVQDQLIAAERARMTLHIAAVPESIVFKESPAGVFLRVRGEKWEGVVHTDTQQRDPIAYVIEGTAVLIVEQFGDFTLEQSTITDAANSQYLV